MIDSRRRLLKLGVASGLSACAVGTMPALAAQALDRPLRLLVGYAPGGATDSIARLLAPGLQRLLGVPVVVENLAGAGGRIAAQRFSRTTKDENVLMLTTPAVIVLAPLINSNVGYDSEADFIPLSQVNEFSFGLAVGATSPIKTVAELGAGLRAGSVKGTFGVSAAGSLPHFFALMLGNEFGFEAVVIPYRGSSPMLADLVGGQVPLGLDDVQVMTPFHEANKIRLLAVASEQRSDKLPAVPTFRESGIDIVASGWTTFFAPRAMPLDRVDLLGKAVVEAMREPELQAAFRKASLNPVVRDRAQTEAMLKAYRAQWTPFVKRSGLKLD